MAIARLATYGMKGNRAVIYGLFDPRTGHVFYVGVTTQQLCNRLAGHYSMALNQRCPGERNDAIRDIRASGHWVEIAELEAVHINDWIEAEQFWIQSLRFLGARLTNKAAGGPGNTGGKQSAETRLRRKAAAAGRDMSIVHSPESRRKARDGNAHIIVVDGVQYSGIRAAAAALGLSYGTVHRRLDLGIYTRLTPRERGAPVSLKGRPSGSAHHNAKPVLVGGQEYPTATAAAAALGLCVSAVRRRLKVGTASYL